MPTWWAGYYVPGERNEHRESTGTADHDEAKRFLKGRLGEVARGERSPGSLEKKTVKDLLELVRKDREDSGAFLPPGYLEAFIAEIGHLRVKEVNRETLDDVVRKWKRQGPTWPGRLARRQQPLSGGTCNRYMALLRRGYSLAREKWGLVTGLTFPHERETARGRYMPPEVFYAIHAHLPTQVATVDTLRPDFGDPLNTTSFALCLYDGTGLRMTANIPAGGTCGTIPCWKETSSVKYGDNLLTPDGIQKATLKPGLALKAKVGVKGKGDNVPMPTLPLTGTAVVQLVRSDSATCWQATFSSPRLNDGIKYTAKSD